MDKQYLDALTIMENSKYNLQCIFNKVNNKSFENKKEYQALEIILEKLEDCISNMKHYSKKTQEGILYKLSNGKWAFKNNFNEEIYFSCGYPIEVFNDKLCEWHGGRMEHKDGEYYFYNYDGDNLNLYIGMRVRVRKDY